MLLTESRLRKIIEEEYEKMIREKGHDLKKEGFRGGGSYRKQRRDAYLQSIEADQKEVTRADRYNSNIIDDEHLRNIIYAEAPQQDVETYLEDAQGMDRSYGNRYSGAEKGINSGTMSSSRRLASFLNSRGWRTYKGHDLFTGVLSDPDYNN